MDNSKSTVKKQFRLRLNELIRGKPTPLISQTEDGVYNPESKVFYFPRFDFTSDMSMSSTPVHLKTFTLEILEIDPKNPNKSK
jgi:hypothetical protein